MVCVGLVAAPAASAATRVFYSNTGANTIYSANLDGSGDAALFTGLATINNPQGKAFDPAAGRIYWANVGGNNISFANINGTGGGDLSTGAATPGNRNSVAIDPGAGRIYWSNSSANKISFVNLNGTGGGDVSPGAATVSAPQGVAVNPAAGRIYWANTGGVPNTISFANTDGTGGANLNTGGATVNTPTGMAVDAAAGRIYWANQNGTMKISFANLDGSGGADLFTGTATPSSPIGVAVDPTAGRIYWANITSDKISAANLDGSGGSDLFTPTLANPAYPILLQSPLGAGAPSISGGTAVGSALSCSQGTWAPDLPPSFVYRAAQSFAHAWSQDGTPIAGATSSSITAASPGSYTCEVTATNQTGSTSQSSAAFTVSGPSGSPSASPVAIPSVSGLSVSPKNLRAAAKGASITAKKTGATVRYTDSHASSTTFTVLKPTKGFTRKGRCGAKRPAGKKKAKRCKFNKPVGSFSRTDKAGPNAFRFSGRVRGKKLRRGAYRLQAIPTLAGRKGTARSTAFKVVR